MGANYNVKLTNGDITPGALYTVYYDTVGANNIATLLTTNQLAQNLTLSQLLAGIDIDIPLSATKIIIDGEGFCEHQLVINIQPTNSTIPPNLCFTFNSQTGLQKINFNLNGTQNGKTKWTSSDGVYTIFYNNVLTPAEWTIQIDTLNRFINQSTNDVPLGTWSAQGPNASSYSQGSMVQGTCPSENCNLTATGKVGIANSTTQTATVTVITNGGTSPFSFSLDGATPQLVSYFPSVGVGQHTILVTDSNGCTYSLNFTVNASSPLVAKTLTLTGLESVVSQGANTSIKRNNFKLEIVPPLVQGEEIQFDLSLDDLSKVYEPGTGTIQKTIVLNKNNNPISPSISTTTNSESRIDCGQNLPISVTADTLQYNMLTMGYNDVISGSVLSTLSITNGGQINGQCATKLTEDVTFNLSQNPTIIQGTGTFTINNLTPSGNLIQNSVVASSPAQIPTVGSLTPNCRVNGNCNSNSVCQIRFNVPVDGAPNGAYIQIQNQTGSVLVYNQFPPNALIDFYENGAQSVSFDIVIKDSNNNELSRYSKSISHSSYFQYINVCTTAS